MTPALQASAAAKFTNLSTPRRPERKGSAVVLAYCRAAEKESLRQLLEPGWGAGIAWKSNQQSFAELQNK